MIKRTTVSAEADDLAVLEDEARRRGVSVARVLREALAEAAAARRAQRPRPRTGIFRGDGSAGGRKSAEDEASPAAGRLQS